MNTMATAGSPMPAVASPGIARLGLALAVFMQVLDTTIATVSLPTIAGDLAASASQSSWVITSFAIGNAIALPLTGFFVRRMGEVRTFLIATLAFTIASVLCGSAGSLGMLVAFRALQGAVAGPMIPTTQALMISLYPPEKRGTALSIIAMVTVVAPIAGPLLGGWITESYSWRWSFFINLPVGLFACVVIARQLGKRITPLRPAKVDTVGLAALITAVGCIQLVLDRGNELDWFGSTEIVLIAIIGALATMIFLIWELTEANPIVDLRLFRHRNFAVGSMTLVIAYPSFFAANVIVPQWLQRTLDYTAIWSGWATAPMGILPVILMPLLGRHAGRFNMRLLVCMAFAILAAASFLRSGFTPDVPFGWIAAIQLLQGLGLALFIMPINAILLSDLKPEQIAAGSGLSTFLRTLGASFAVSTTAFLWDRRSLVHHASLTESVSLYEPHVRQSLDAMRKMVGPATNGLLDQAISLQSSQMGFNDVMLALGGMFLLAILLVWFAKPPFIARARR